MLRRLKLKIITVVLGTLLVVFAAVLLVLNMSIYQTSERRTEEFMTAVIENDGFPFLLKGRHSSRRETSPDGYGSPNGYGSPEVMREGRFFYAKVDAGGEVLELDLQMMFDFSKEDAQRIIESVFGEKRAKGAIGNFSFVSAEKPYGQIFVFAQRSIEISLLEQLTRISLKVAAVVSLLLACLSAFFSKWMVTPIKAAFDKQRRFISDASHELKTPLTIIGANVDVLQNEIGENQRLQAIKAQSNRMNDLVHGLLALAKTDEGKTEAVMSGFDLSGAILHTVLEFESRAFEEKKQYTYDIGENIAYVGDEKQIKQLTIILIDNAIQYSDPNGQVSVALHAGNSHPCLSVYNTGIGVLENEYGKIFERFYRSDESRSRETGGYGVGLSIAKAIVESHKGKISVSGEHGKWIRFDVTL